MHVLFVYGPQKILNNTRLNDLVSIMFNPVNSNTQVENKQKKACENKMKGILNQENNILI